MKERMVVVLAQLKLQLENIDRQAVAINGAIQVLEKLLKEAEDVGSGNESKG